MPQELTNDIEKIRHQNPLIHNITNFVTMDLIANGLIALGASPVMAHSKKELDDMIAISSSIVINIGTIDEYWEECFKHAILKAQELKKPIILDPVGAGATPYRTRVIYELLSLGHIDVLKGNASEIMSIAGIDANTKGVDSKNSTEEAIDGAWKISKTYGICVVISGKKDVIINQQEAQILEYGHPLMAKVCGMGCLLSAVIAAFNAINADSAKSAVHAATLMGIIGEITSELQYVRGPASFKAAFIDQLYMLDIRSIQKKFKTHLSYVL